MRFLACAAASLALVACGDIGGGSTETDDATAPASASEEAPQSATGGPPPMLRTASDARAHMERSGFSEVTNIQLDENGRWTANAKYPADPARGGMMDVRVVIDSAGVVTIAE